MNEQTNEQMNEQTNIRMDKRKDENYIPLGINAGGIIKKITILPFYWHSHGYTGSIIRISNMFSCTMVLCLYIVGKLYDNKEFYIF